MRLPFRPELEQPAGVVHGGAVATLVDTVVVPAVGQAYPADYAYFTIQMDVRYIGAVAKEDAIAEGWIEQRGRTVVFCRAEVRVASGQLVAEGPLNYGSDERRVGTEGGSTCRGRGSAEHNKKKTQYRNRVIH